MTDEIMKDAELDAVVGGSGIECMALMHRLQVEGLANFKTPLVAGNEAAAAKELQSYLNDMKIDGLKVELHSDSTSNSYSVADPYLIFRCNPVYRSINEEDLVGLVKKHLGVI